MHLSLLYLGLSLLTAAPRDAEISGTVIFRGKPVKDAVVYFEGEKKGAPLKNVMIDQRGKRFLPHVTVVTPGTQIEFPNNDSVFHNVYAAFEASTFDLGEYPRGAVKRRRFDKCGVVALLCNIHSEMGAYIVVVNTPYYAITDSKGRFSVSVVDSGTYTMRGWHEGGGSYSQTVKIEGNMALPVELRRK